MFTLLSLQIGWAVLILRVIYGFIFITHGSQKLFGGLAGTAQFFEQVGFKPGKFWARVVATVEFVAGICLVLGLFTRLAAFLIAVIMVAAIIKVKGKQGFVNGYEFDLLLLAVSIFFFFAGAGGYSFDYIW